MYSAVLLMNFAPPVFSLLTSLCFNVQISQPYKSDGIAKIFYTFNPDCLWTKFGFKILFRIPNIMYKITLFLRYVPFLYVVHFSKPWFRILSKRRQQERGGCSL
jgi:hypothetical protein